MAKKNYGICIEGTTDGLYYYWSDACYYGIFTIQM